MTSTDRLLWAWLSRTWRGWRSALHIVKPEAVVGCHRHGFRLFWTWKSRRRTGRPGVPADVRAVIRELSEANPLWGAPRIHGELQKLGVVVSQSTVAKDTRRHPRPPSQTWRTFLTNHASQIVAADLFVVPTVTFRLLSVLVILAHDMDVSIATGVVVCGSQSRRVADLLPTVGARETHHRLAAEQAMLGRSSSGTLAIAGARQDLASQ